MKIYTITNQFSKKLLKKFILNFIKTNEIESRYVSVHLQLMLKDNDLVDLGNAYMLDKLNIKSINLLIKSE